MGRKIPPMPAKSPCPAQRGTKKGKSGGPRRPGPCGRAPASAVLPARLFRCCFSERNLRSWGFAFLAPPSMNASFPPGVFPGGMQPCIPAAVPPPRAAFPGGVLGGVVSVRILQAARPAGLCRSLLTGKCRASPGASPGFSFSRGIFALARSGPAVFRGTRGL